MDLVLLKQILSSKNSELMQELAKKEGERYILKERAMQSAFSSFFPFWTMELQKKLKRNLLIVTPNNEQAYLFNRDYRVYEMEVPVVPSWEAVMGSEMQKHASIRSERAAALYAIAANAYPIVLCSLESYLQLLPDPESMQGYCMKITEGASIEISDIVEKLIQWNFTRVGQVEAHGEFAVRGEIIDICTAEERTGNFGLRINFDFGRVETLKRFNISSQYATEKLNSILLHPHVEFLWNEISMNTVTKKFHSEFPELNSQAVDNIKEAVSNNGYSSREYLFYPFILEKHSHITRYFSKAPLVLFTHFEQHAGIEQRYWSKLENVFLEQGFHFPIPRPSRYKEKLAEFINNAEAIKISEDSIRQKKRVGDSKNKHFASNMRYFIKYCSELCKNDKSKVFLTASNDTQKERLRQLCTDELLNLENFSILTADLCKGFSILENALQLFTEADLFGRKLKNINPEHLQAIYSLEQIQKGDLVVHILYGIAKFIGIERRELRGVEKDYIHLEYAHAERLFVPVEQMNMVQCYIGQNAEAVKLDSLGSASWRKKKSRVEKNIEDMSQELLELEAQRSSLTGFSFPFHDWEREFLKDFQHEETVDQAQAWKEIESDMQRALPMDRLLVGDVGFGKTELAFRAAFRALSNSRQVVMLVPTTILAEQHYLSALERFRNFPVSIEMLSRFVSPRQQKKIIQDLQGGKLDFLIATHRVLQKDIFFSNLGLMIIDEEHRFGVKNKEQIKKLKHNVDCISMSATPIPRTLYQSLVKLRDLSSLTTAPKKRKPIQTFVEQFSEDLVQKAVRKELERKGQVFVLHNRVNSLEQMKELLQRLVPEATILTASGQMQSSELENVMYQFTHGAANILVSTTIIENGIDIPNVNTIIIDRADYYGISQLYQLRGRVGRSDREAYAYLLYPNEQQLSDLALKRLTVISDHTDLGSGFHIAMRDLEVRGAGNLLGREQSGNIYAVGYEHYMQLLDKTMKRMKGQHVEEEIEPVLELEFTGYIPDSYVPEPASKMELYKKMVSVKNMEEHSTLLLEIEDRYGKIPLSMRGLIYISKLRILCRKLRITLIRDRARTLELHFDKISLLPELKMKKLLSNRKITMHPAKPNVLLLPYEDLDLKSKYILILNSFANEN